MTAILPNQAFSGVNVPSLFLQSLPIGSVTQMPSPAVIDAFRNGPAPSDVASQAATSWRQPSTLKTHAAQEAHGAAPADGATDIWNPDHPFFVRNMIERMEQWEPTRDGKTSRVYERDPGGPMIFSDLVLRHVQQHPGDEIFNVRRIARAQASLKDMLGETESDELRRAIDNRLALLDLSRIHLVVSHVGRLNQQQIGPLTRALEKLDGMIEGATDQRDGVDQCFFANMLKIEIHARMMEIEGYRGNHDEKDKARVALVEHLKALEDPLIASDDEGQRAIASRFFADAALLLMKMRFPKEALHVANFVTSNFVMSAGAVR